MQEQWPPGRPDAVDAELAERAKGDWSTTDGRTFGLVYSRSPEHSALVARAVTRFGATNAISGKAFPSLVQMEREVVDAVCALLGGGVGAMTSGGTESILLPMKAYRDRYRASGGQGVPQIVLGHSAHPAFHKACAWFDLEPVFAPARADGRLDPAAVDGLITERTVALVGSAPSLPLGVVDPIAALGELALRHGIGLHVDACLGSFVLPFLEELGVDVPAFDLRVPGVSSISADLHKYGYGPKGSSVVIYRDAALRRFQLFGSDAWTGGLYGTTGMAGTRPGGPVAGAWASLRALGRDGYLQAVRETWEATRRIQAGVRSLGLEVLSDPDMTVFCFAPPADAGIDVHAISDALEARGWRFQRMYHPPSISLIVTPPHLAQVGAFLADLEASLGEARQRGGSSRTRQYYAVSVGAEAKGADAVLDALEARWER